MLKNNTLFSDRVRDVVKQIPRGKTMSYKQVAEIAGNPRASRAVAGVMSRNYNLEIPCHRVICSNGELGGYNRGGIETKRKILLAEGVIFK
jgi:O-6-methylguanine DNA methyltransferase